MSELSNLRSYLVGLGFNVNMSEFTKFKSIFGEAEKVSVQSVGKIGQEVLKFQAGVTSTFIAVGAAIVGTLDKVAMADQDYRLFGERMFLDTKHARGMQIAVDALGHSLDEIAFDPELYQRFQLLQKDQIALGAGLGGDFESTMREIRDVRFEFTRLKVELQYGLMGFAKDVFQELGFGSGDFAKQLGNINDFIITNLPKWSREFAQDVVPILKDTWDILKGVGDIAGDLANDFTNLVAIFSGDSSLKSATFDFHKFAGAVEKVAHFLAEVVELLEYVERKVGALTFLGAAGGGTVGGGIDTLVGGIAGIEAGPAGVLAGAAAGGATGTAIGTGVGAGLGFLGHIAANLRGSTANPHEQTAIADQARQIAKAVSARTGIPAQLVFAQMEHETDHFKNRGARDLHNLAGIRVPGSTEYRNFSSFADFADYYSKLLTSSRYTSKGILQAKTPQEYTTALKAGGYMEDSVVNYSRGMSAAMSDYYKGGSGETTINVGGVTVNNPSSTTDVTKGVVDAMNRKQSTQIQRNIQQFTPVYQ